MIYQTINFSEFRDAFVRYGRGDQFSYQALGVIFEYLEESGEDSSLDVVAICCDFVESDWESIADDYGIDLACFDDDEKIDAVREYLEQNTTIAGETDNTFIYINF